MRMLQSVMLGAAIVAVSAMPAAAIELSPETTKPVPSLFAKVSDKGISYGKSVIAYSPSTFNTILEAYGVTLVPESVENAPFTYAKVKGDTISYSKSATAYDPSQYHSIFTAYGLELSVEKAKELLGGINYAKIVDGKPVFSKSPFAYSGDELALILKAYELPQPMEIKTVEKTEAPKPMDSDKDGVIDSQDKCPGTPMGAKVDERGCWALSASYLFGFDKDTIRSEYYPNLDEVVKVLDQNAGLKIQIQGHTCSIGSDAYNQGLSERRANSVLRYLESKGIASDRLTFKGFGESSPAYSNDTEDGREKNRRVELNPQW